MITNRDMARFAELASAGPGPIAIGAADVPVYVQFARLGYVEGRGSMFHVTEAGEKAAMQWLREPGLVPRERRAPNRRRYLPDNVVTNF